MPERLCPAISRRDWRGRQRTRPLQPLSRRRLRRFATQQALWRRSRPRRARCRARPGVRGLCARTAAERALWRFRHPRRFCRQDGQWPRFSCQCRPAAHGMSGDHKSVENKPERFGDLARLPLFFALQEKRAVIAGGSPAAAWKAELLSAAGARVEVFCADVSDEMQQAAGDTPCGGIVIHRREWIAADLRGAALAVGDFRDDERAAAFFRAAHAAGVPVNIIDQPEFCDFSFGAIVNRSPLVIGISTDGAAPAVAQAIRGKIEAILPKGISDWIAAAARWRDAVKSSGLAFAGRRKFWRLFAAYAMANAGSAPCQADFDRCIGAGPAQERGSVTLVSLDGSDAESLTLGAIRALQSADVILFDDGVPAEVFDFARREARKISIGGTSYDGVSRPRRTDALDALMKQGRCIVVVANGSHDKRVWRPFSSAA